jgi:4-hydroxyphenylacetate 3-monooxygenase
MGARSGSNYLSSLKKLNAEVWLGGERVAEVTSHPAFRSCSRSIASLYDMQMERPEQMTYRTDDGGRAGLSFIQPKSLDEVRKRSRMMAAWANFSGGMLGRTPDYLNASIAAMAAARDFFAASDPRFGDNIANYYLEARKHDWCATHTLVNPRASRAQGWAGHTDEELALRLVEKTGEGIVVKGARMLATLAPLSEELLVFPSTVLKADPAAEPFALAFAIPCNAKGLKFICRDSFDPVLDRSRAHFDAPLASRFDEMDCVVIFNEVTVPWQRVFLCGDVARCNALYGETNAVVHMMHQVIVKNVAKAEFLLGLATRIAEVTDALSLQHVRERLAEMITTTETMRACLRASEADAATDKWGVTVPARPPLDTARNLFPRLYPRMVEIIQLNSSSHLMATPSERDFASAMKSDIEKYYPAAGADAPERVALYRLAWDVAGSAFAGRQVLYERFFFGDPVRMASALVDNTDLKPLTQRIKDFLNRTD